MARAKVRFAEGGFLSSHHNEDFQRRTIDPLAACVESKADASEKLRTARSIGVLMNTASKVLTMVIHSRKVVTSYKEKSVTSVRQISQR